MNKKQRQFAHEYIVDCNGRQAAIRAGYAAKNADVAASKTLAIPDVAALVKSLLAEKEKKTGMSAEYVLNVFKTVIDRGLQAVKVMEFDPVTKDMVQKVDPRTGEGMWECDLTAVNTAASWVGKHLKMFTEKMEVEFKGNLAEDIKAARKRRENA